jgi:tetratricopeptide (TPR) repeat protein
MAQAATNPKIEELRGKLKADPKSRLFYQLAEELRKNGQPVESEQLLRNGLTSYPTYLAAWVSLGRVCRELKKDEGAVEALNKALQLDPGNVVAARLLGDAYLALGQHVEAIKKYKLVHAILPNDDELNDQIRRLEEQLNPQPLAVVSETAVFDDPSTSFAETEAPFASESSASESSASESRELSEAAVFSSELVPDASGSVSGALQDSPFDRTMPPFGDPAEVFAQHAATAEETADDEPMSVAHAESPFEDEIGGYTAAAVTIEAPSGMQIVSAPMGAEVAAPFEDDRPPVMDSTPVFDSPEPAGSAADDASETLTMADLYVRQGLVEEARHIYENLLARDPGNEEVRARLAGIAPRANEKVLRLERWLARMTGKAERSV